MPFPPLGMLECNLHQGRDFITPFLVPVTMLAIWQALKKYLLNERMKE